MRGQIEPAERIRRDDVADVRQNVAGTDVIIQGNCGRRTVYIKYTGNDILPPLNVPAVPAVIVSTSKIEETPVSASGDAVSVPAVPRCAGVVELIYAFLSATDCFQDGLYRRENQTGMLRWPQGGVYGQVPTWGSVAGRYPGIYSLKKHQYVFF